MSYVRPIFTDAEGKICEGEKAWEKGLVAFSNVGLLAIPNRPFSGKPIAFVAGKNPPNGDYREPLTQGEFNLLQEAIPGLSIRVVDSMPELTDPNLELFLREYYHMGDRRIGSLTWAQIFDACERYLANQKQGESQQYEDSKDGEIDPSTKEQSWRDKVPEYIPNADAVKIAEGQIRAPYLSKMLRKPGNTVRWMRNRKTRRSKVHLEDFKRFLKDRKSTDRLSDAAIRQSLETKERIDSDKRMTGQ